MRDPAWIKECREIWCEAAGGFLAAIFRIGDVLLQERINHKGGGFKDAVNDAYERGRLPFRYDVARMFLRIARNQELVKSDVYPLLPPNHQLLSKIARLDSETLHRLIDDGTIHPTCKFGDINRVLRISKQQADEARVLQLVPIVGKFRTLVFDPAWEYDWLSVAGRAKPGYAMQPLDELRALDVKGWAESECHLWCWTTNNFSYEAHKLVEHWGFQHRTILTWIKPHFGLGTYLRNATEHVLFATLGDTTTRPAAASIGTWFMAETGEHSEKPEEFYDIVRAASYPPYGEANQRKARADFTNLYETVESDDGQEAAE